MPTCFSGSSGSMDAAQPELEWSVGASRPAAQHQDQHGLRAAVRRRAGAGCRRASRAVLGGWRIAVIQNYTSGLPIGVTTRGAAADLQRHKPSECHRRRLARADRRRQVRSRLVDKFLERAAFRAPVGAAWQCAADQRRRAPALELTENISVAKTDHGDEQLRMDIRVGSVQPVQPRCLGSAEHRLQQRKISASITPGQLAPADAVRAEALLVGAP